MVFCRAEQSLYQSYSSEDMPKRSFKSAPAQKALSHSLERINARVLPWPFSLCKPSTTPFSSLSSCCEMALRALGRSSDSTVMVPACGAGILEILRAAPSDEARQRCWETAAFSHCLLAATTLRREKRPNMIAAWWTPASSERGSLGARRDAVQCKLANHCLAWMDGPRQSGSAVSRRALVTCANGAISTRHDVLDTPRESVDLTIITLSRPHDCYDWPAGILTSDCSPSRCYTYNLTTPRTFPNRSLFRRRSPALVCPALGDRKPFQPYQPTNHFSTNIHCE
jgi:hypothetical protein